MSEWYSKKGAMAEFEIIQGGRKNKLASLFLSLRHSNDAIYEFSEKRRSNGPDRRAAAGYRQADQT